jgi:hypothetical protein
MEPFTPRPSREAKFSNGLLSFSTPRRLQTGCPARDAERLESVNHFHLQVRFNKLERVTYIVDKYFEEARIRDDFYL